LALAGEADMKECPRPGVPVAFPLEAMDRMDKLLIDWQARVDEALPEGWEQDLPSRVGDEWLVRAMNTGPAREGQRRGVQARHVSLSAAYRDLITGLRKL
jgi:hypothetical protein